MPNIIEAHLEPHPNANTLSIVRLDNGYTTVVKTKEFSTSPKGIFCPPKTVLPSTPYFANCPSPVKPRMLRGTVSHGILVPLSELPLTTPLPTKQLPHYPPLYCGPVYKTLDWYKFHKYLQKDEPVEITELLPGPLNRLTYQGGKFYWGGKYKYFNPTAKAPQGEALAQLSSLVKKAPNRIFYLVLPWRGRRTTILDIYTQEEHRFLSLAERNEVLGLDPKWRPPVLYQGPYSPIKVHQLLNGDSLLNHHKLRKGMVIRPLEERSQEGRRCIFHVYSPKYLAQYRKSHDR